MCHVSAGVCDLSNSRRNVHTESRKDKRRNRVRVQSSTVDSSAGQCKRVVLWFDPEDRFLTTFSQHHGLSSPSSTPPHISSPALQHSCVVQSLSEKRKGRGTARDGKGAAASGQLSLNSSTPVPLHSRIYTDPEKAEHNHQWKYNNRNLQTYLLHNSVTKLLK